MPKVTVIIATYNAIAYLPSTIDSVIKQTFTDFEVLIVDDGSTDETVDWVSKLVDPRVRLISQANQGVAVARNQGITGARGEYVAFLDADDLWEPTKLEKQVKCLEENPLVGLVNTSIVNIDEQGKPLGAVNASDVEGNVLKYIVEENLILCGSAPMVRRSCLEAVQGFDQKLMSAEDWDLWIRLAARYDFAVIREPLVLYRQHLNSKSNNIERHLKHRLKVIDKTFDTVARDLQPYKNRALGRAYLSVAWKSLVQKDYQTSTMYRQKALSYYPQLRFGENYIRLTAMTTAKQLLGNQGYSVLRSLVHSFKKQPKPLS